MTLKYIVTQDEDGTEDIFVFPKRYNHDDFASDINGLRVRDPNNHREWKRHRKEPIAAGFVDGLDCHGRSETLDLASRGQRDSMLLRS